MALIHLPATASAERGAAAIEEHGYVIIDRLAEGATMDRLFAEIEPYVRASPFGDTDLTGKLTQRTGALIERSPTARSLIMNDLVLGIVGLCLKHARSFQLSLTELITLSPGAPAQFIHRDELLFDAYPFRNDYEVQISTLWAVSDYTEEMGATRVVPDSHRLDGNAKFAPEDTHAAVMDKGSVLIYSGKLYHGGGRNASDKMRIAMNIDYAVGWVRQEENQYLSCSPAVARTLPPQLLKLMGYHAPRGHGRVYDWNDPLAALLGEMKKVAEPSPDVQNVYSEPVPTA